MIKEIDNYFAQQDEPIGSCLAALRHFVLTFTPGISEVWRYRMPFYCIDGKRFCYLWVDKKRLQPYFGFVDGGQIDHPDLISEKRSRMKIYLVDPTQDLDLEKISLLLNQAMLLAR